MLLPNRNGFTLIEIMTTLAIIAILMTVAIPSYIGYKPTLLLNRAVNEYHSILQQARLMAIKNRGDCTIVFTAKDYTVSCETSNYKRTVNYADYGELVLFERSDGSSGVPASSLTFNSRGTCNSAYMFITNKQRKEFYRIGPLISGVIKKDQEVPPTSGNWVPL